MFWLLPYATEEHAVVTPKDVSFSHFFERTGVWAMQPDELTAETYQPLIGETLTCVTEIGDVALELVAVTVQPEIRSRNTELEVDGKVMGPRAAFSLSLKGPVEPVLGQGLYALTHDQLGETTLFLSPYAQDASGISYSVDFN